MPNEVPNCNSPNCDYMFVRAEVAKQVKDEMPTDRELYVLSEFYKTFGDMTRIRILYALFNNEMCVCDIAKLLGMSVSAISHQLKVLTTASLIKFRRVGKTVFYSLADGHVEEIIDNGNKHISETR